MCRRVSARGEGTQPLRTLERGVWTLVTRNASRKSVLLVAASLFAGPTLAQEVAKIDYFCKWREGEEVRTHRYHINLATNIVDAQVAKRDADVLTFVQANVEHKIDLANGTVQTRDLKVQGAAVIALGCKKLPALQTEFVSNPR